MSEAYIPVALMGTKNSETDEYPFIQLYARRSEIAGFLDGNAEVIQEKPEDNFTPVGVIAIVTGNSTKFKPINVYARFGEWLNISAVASDHITGGAMERRYLN